MVLQPVSARGYSRCDSRRGFLTRRLLFATGWAGSGAGRDPSPVLLRAHRARSPDRGLLALGSLLTQAAHGRADRGRIRGGPLGARFLAGRSLAMQEGSQDNGRRSLSKVVTITARPAALRPEK